MPNLSRRAFGVAMGATWGATALATTACSPKTALPAWVGDLRRDLNAMATELTERLKPWTGRDEIFTPESFGALTPKATSAIQAAIDAAHAAGGGTVRLNSGDYVSGTLDLKSHVRLEVAKGARLLGSLDLNDYPDRVAKRPTVMDSNMGMNQSLIFAEGCENIAICGEGVIDGRGHNFKGEETIHGTPGRPFLIRVIDSKRIHVADITLKDSPCWMQNYLNCDDLLVERMTVENQANFNNDGIDIDGCRNVIIRNSHINSGDDGICFKGCAGTPGENILIEHCKVYTSCNAIKHGTDSQSPFRNVLIRHCEIGGVSEDMRRIKHVGADSGFSWESVDGGTLENILAHDIHIIRARSPFFLRIEDRARVFPGLPRPPIGTIRRIVFEDITGEDNGPRGSYILSIPEKPVEEIVFRNVNLSQRASNDFLTEDQIPDMRGIYPDAHMIDRDRERLGHDADGRPNGGDAPAYGLWARHDDGLWLENYQVTPVGEDPRPDVLAQTGVTRFTRT